MSEYRPTKAQQRALYNHFMPLIYGSNFPLASAGDRVTFDRAKILWALKTLYGASCHVPNCTRNPPYELIVEHINGDRSDYRPENLRLACKSCNQIERQFQQLPAFDTGKPEKEIAAGSESGSASAEAEAAEIQRSKDAVKRIRLESRSEIIFQKSKEYYRRARIYLTQNVAIDGAIDEEKALLDIMYITGCKEKAAQTYIEILTSDLAPFQIVIREGKNVIVRHKNYNPAYTNKEDQEIDAEAERQVLAERARQVDDKEERVKQREIESKAIQLQLLAAKQLGAYIEPEKYKIDPSEYARKETKYLSHGWHYCILCGSKFANTSSDQIVCNGCKASRPTLVQTPKPESTTSINRSDQP